MLAFITLPSPSSWVSEISQWSSAFFDNIAPVVWYAVGLLLVIFIIRLIIGIFRS